MDEDCTIPQYKVFDTTSFRDLEEYINTNALNGWEVLKFSTCTTTYSHFSVVMVKRVSRLEVLVKDGKVVK